VSVEACEAVPQCQVLRLIVFGCCLGSGCTRWEEKKSEEETSGQYPQQPEWVMERGPQLTSRDQQDKHNPHERRAVKGGGGVLRKNKKKSKLLFVGGLVSPIPRVGLILSVPQLQECRRTGFVLSPPMPPCSYSLQVLPRVAFAGPEQCRELPAQVCGSTRQDG